MQMRVTKRFTFESHHKLPWHTGKCARDHGHSYVLEVSVRGIVKPDNGAPDSGMVLDFGEISSKVKPLVADMDHRSLNDLVQNPTAERMVEYIVSLLRVELPGLEMVRLYETSTGWVEWQNE